MTTGYRAPLLVLGAASLLGVGSCYPTATSQTPTKTQITYVLNNICVPVIADHVSFSSIVSAEHLERRDRCDILYGCRLWYCAPDQGICFQPPTDRWCWATFSGDSNFDRLSGDVLKALDTGTRRWRLVSSISTLPGYKKAFCADDGGTEVDVAGFVEGQTIIGYTPPIRGYPGSGGSPIKAIGTEFDIHVHAPPDPRQCPNRPVAAPYLSAPDGHAPRPGIARGA